MSQFRKMIRSKQEIPENECIELLNNHVRGILSVNGDNGYPYGIPINYWHNEENGKIYFHSGRIGHKLDSIKNNNKVSFCVYDEGFKKEGEWALNIKSVIIFGEIKIIDDEDIIRQIMYSFSRKFTNDNDYIENEIENFTKATLLLELSPKHMSGKLVNES